MLTKQQLTQLSTKDLRRRKNLHQIALGVVWLGGGFAFGAGLARMGDGNPEVIEMMSTAAMALMVSIPVYFQKKKILAVLRAR